MHSKVLFAFAVAVGSLTGCGVSDDLSESADGEVENVSTTDSALTTPPSGVGFVNDGVGHLKNGTGTCAYKNGTKFDSAACANVSNQLFVYYKMSDGRYHLCVPDTLTYFAGTRYVNTQYHRYSYDVQGYRATCLYRDPIYSSDERLLFGTTELASSVKSNGSYGPYSAAAGLIYPEEKLASGHILGWTDSSRKITKTSNGGIGLFKKSGDINQQWTIY